MGYAKIINKYEIGKTYDAEVTKVQDYGCFAKLEEGLEGLIHQSELSWTKKNIHPGKVLSTSQKIDVQVLEKDYKIGDQGDGVVKNITDFALFISINNSELVG